MMQFLSRSSCQQRRHSNWTLGGSQKSPVKLGVFILPSVLLFVFLSRHFLGIVSLVFSEFWRIARSPYEIVHDTQIFWKKHFCLKIWENGPNMVQKQGFLNSLKDFVINFYWICSVMENQNMVSQSDYRIF